MAGVSTDPQTQLEEEVIDDADLLQELIRYMELKEEVAEYRKKGKELKARFPAEKYAGRRIRIGQFVLTCRMGDSEPREVSFERGPSYRVNVKDTSKE